VKKFCDILVCGGGIAGVAAALAAARRGKKVMLVEKQTIAGGLATSGLIYIYLPLSDDKNRIIAGGITEELLIRAQDYGPFGLSEVWGGHPGADPGGDKERYYCCFSPAGYALTLDKMLRDAGVEVWLDSTVISVACDGRQRIGKVEVFCGSERFEVEAECFIDASGGAYLMRLAGAHFFTERNFVTPWFIEYHRGKAREKEFYLSGDVFVGTAGSRKEQESFASVAKADELQEFIRCQYESVREYFDRSAAGKDHYPLHLPAMPQTRKVARIDGMAVIADGGAGEYCPDSVGVAADWRKLPAPAWETPYGALLSKTVRGALAAGRCINSAGDAWEIFRVIPAAAMTGEAAGTAAALSCRMGIDPADVPVALLQDELRKNGTILHITDGKSAAR